MLKNSHTRNALSKNIIKKLAETNLSQSTLAKIVGVTPASISNYISGRKIPRSKTLFRIAQAFHTEPEKLFCEDENGVMFFEQDMTAIKKNNEAYQKAKKLIETHHEQWNDQQKIELCRILLKESTKNREIL